jgi:crotonobetainyl-CoA:carnitine CoA-transferase CaiB-like acyl-CoA transferase
LRALVGVMDVGFKPLGGIRAVEMSHMIMGPPCGMFLGFLGAEVIKVEPPEGDKTRALSGMGRPMSPLFNRGKKSVQLGLKTEAGRRALRKLLGTADVFVAKILATRRCRAWAPTPSGRRPTFPA